MDVLKKTIVLGGVVFGRRLVGIITRPYETYRTLAFHGQWGELFYLGVLLICYFATASLVKTAAFRPFLLTKQFLVLLVAALTNTVFVMGVLWWATRRVGGKGTFRGVAIAWAYTLVPTILWFFMTSLLYVILPPPRTTSLQGILFSVLYLVISSTLFFWKFILAYLTLRFGAKLDLKKIGVTAAIAIPLVAGESWLMYRLGIFKVPFL